jgi:glycosyltransferase involved in cell wall biosynthesis
MVVVPSVFFEGFPNTITRAMSYGKPVICSRIGALPEIVVEGQTGLLHEPNALDELIACIRHLQESPELCRSLGAQGRQRALTKYNRDRFYDELISIYRSAEADVGREGTGQSRTSNASRHAA